MALGHMRVFREARSDASSYTINGSQPCYNNCCPPPHCQDNRLAVMSLDSSTAQNYSNGGIGVTTETSVAAAYSNNSKQSSFYYSPMLPGNQPHVATVTASAAPIDHYKHFKHGFYSPGMSADVVTQVTGGSVPSSPVQSSRDVTGAAQPTLVANGNESVMDRARTTGQQNHSSIMVTPPQAKTTNSPPMSSSKLTSPPSFYQQMNLHSGIKQQQQPLSEGSKSNEHEQTIPNGDFSKDRTEGQPDPPFNDSQVGSTSPDSRRDTNNKASYTTEPNESLPAAPPDVERNNSTNTDESSPRKPESSENFSFDGPQPNFNDLRESGSLEGIVNDSQDGALYQRYPSSEALTPPSGDDSEKAMGEGANSPTCQRVETHNGYELYYCHLCSYVGNSKYHFNAHMNAHFEHACPQCDYTSRTEGRLKRHIKDFHSDTPPNNFSGSRMLSSSPSSFAPMKREPGRPKLFRCRHCDFSSTTKVEFWDHARTHIKDDKILQCPKCPFVTEYKHHLEYHLRNHFGSKPFRCNKCNYACVNKSMLNSHMKSHTNVYQYRCADCTYATKYCHSLKLHLRKYNHHPATVLNADGSLPVDGSGDFELVSKRGPPRGPRGPRRESMPASKTSPSPPMQITNTAAAAAAAAMMLPQGRPGQSPNGGHSPLNSGMLGPTGFWAMMGHQQHQQAAMAMSHNPNGLQMAPPPLIPITGITPLDIRLPHSIESQVSNSGMQRPQMAPSQHASPGHSGSSPATTSGASPMQFHCNFCGFPADTRGALTQHMLKVHAVENQDLFSMFGIHAESLADESAISNAASAPLVAKSLSYKHETSPPNVSEAWAAMMQSGRGAGGDVPAVTSTVPSMPSCHGLLLPPPDGGIYAMSAMSCASSDMSFANQMLGADSAPRISQFFGQAPPDKVRPRHSGERPLDLTKRRSDGEEEEDMLQRPSPGGPGVKRKVDVEGNDDNSNMSADLVIPTPPRKRSRKGKAYKLDTLSLKMQDQYEDSPPDGDLEDDDVSNQSAPNYSSPANMFREKSVITDGKNSTPQQVFAMMQPEGSTFGSYEASPHSGPVVDFLEGKQRMREMNSVAGKMSNPDGSLSNMRPRSKSIGDIARFSRSPHFPPNCSIDPSSAYSLGMSRRKLFMIQQMEQQISSEQNPTGEMAPSPMATPVATAAMPVAIAAVPVATAAPPAEEEEKSKPATPVTGPESNPCADGKKKEGNKHMYECSHCEIVFRNCVMYTMHMGYHGYHNPLKCNMCGYESKDQLDFFLHIARVAHE